MMFNTKDEAVVAVYKAFPYSDQITDLDTVTGKDDIRFNWRGTSFNLDLSSGYVTEREPPCALIGSNISILATALIKAEWLKSK